MKTDTDTSSRKLLTTWRYQIISRRIPEDSNFEYWFFSRIICLRRLQYYERLS